MAGRSPKCCRQRATESLVGFSWTPFCDSRRRKVRKSARSISWSWLKQEKSTVSVPVTGSRGLQALGADLLHYPLHRRVDRGDRAVVGAEIALQPCLARFGHGGHHAVGAD